MSIVFSEKFEGTGYENVWTELVQAGGTINEDASPGDVSQPQAWDRQCLENISPGGGINISYIDLGANLTIAYIRFEFICTAESMVSDSSVVLFEGWSTGWGIFNVCINLYRSGVDRVIVFNPKLDGVTESYQTTPFTLNTLYRIEIKWDGTNHKVQWKVNGVADTELTLTAGHGLIGVLVVGNDAWAVGGTVYYDLVAVDDSGWIGPEGSPAVKRFAGIPHQRFNKGVW